MSVTVRRAKREDARTIAEMALKLVVQHEKYNPKRFSRLADAQQMEWFYGGQTQAKDAAVLIAETDGKIVGFAYVQYESKNYADMLVSAAWLHDIYVDEAARGTNAGRLLIEKSVETAKEFGAGKLMLSVAARNERARNFFKRSGFETTMFEMMLDLSEEVSI